MNDASMTQPARPAPDHDAPDGVIAGLRSRRAFFSTAAGAIAASGALALPGRAAGQTATPTPTPSPSSTATSSIGSIDYLNVALNVLYLKANFYSFATTGSAIASTLQTGVTTQGAAGAATGGRVATFDDALVGEFAREIAADAIANLTFLRGYLGLGAVAQPAIDLSVGGAWSALMTGAGVIGSGASFDPYANSNNFLLAAFFLADFPIGIYKSVGPVSGTVTILEALGGLVGTESYHSATIRTTIFRKGRENPASGLIENSEKISAFRDTLDGAPTEALTTGYAPDDDQGVSPGTNAAGQLVSNIVPTNANGIAYSRTFDRIANILYLGTGARTSGGFFPAGLNGNLKTGAA